MDRSFRVTVALVALAGLGPLFIVSASQAQLTVPSDASRAAYLVDAAVASPPLRKATKILVVVEENHSLSQMREGMPYTFSLAQKYGYGSHYYALAHPSLPNYIAIASGSTRGIRDDKGPAAHRLHGHSVFGRAIAHGRTAGVFAEAMPAACVIKNAWPYAVRHNPWAYFVDERQQCRAHDVPSTSFEDAVATGALPRAGMLVPDLEHDAHDGTLATADQWFRDVMTTVFAGADWQSGHLVVVLTADEDDRAHRNRVLTVVIHPSQDHNVVAQRLDHSSLARLYAEVTNVPALPAVASAVSMAEAFGLPVPRH
jgi:acid phosphatase